MASNSPPPNPSDNNPPFSASEPVQAVVNEPQTASEEISSKSVFVNSQPIREEQVQNAVNFLSHPRVQGSPVLHRRNFLEKKGLTKEEIDEAFRRVPDPSPAVASGQSSTYQDAKATPVTKIQAQTPMQEMQPVPAVQPGVVSMMARKFCWSHAVLAGGFLAISGAGAAIAFKKSIIPRLKSWILKVVDGDNFDEKTAGKPSLAEEAVVAAKAAAAAAADVAKASQEMLTTQNEEKKRFAEFMSLLDVQMQEMKTVRNAITKLEGKAYVAGRDHVENEYLNGSIARSMQPMDYKSEYDVRSVRSVSPPASTEPPHPKSYAEFMAMAQRGERPPNARPWEVDQPASNSSFTPQSQVTNGVSSYLAQDNGVVYQYNNDNSTPWWQQKSAGITEIENGDDHKFGSALNRTTSVGPTQRRWVPPQPPPVQMPEAAVAIRQPKSTPKDINLKAEEDTAQPVGELDELDRITKISESGGQVEINNGGGGSSEINVSEIQEQVTEL